MKTIFDWDSNKNLDNLQKHGIDFGDAQHAFFDPYRVILKDVSHSTKSEVRYFCIGKIDNGIVTVRFTDRNKVIRIFGAGYWRKGKKIYEKEN